MDEYFTNPGPGWAHPQQIDLLSAQTQAEFDGSGNRQFSVVMTPLRVQPSTVSEGFRARQQAGDTSTTETRRFCFVLLFTCQDASAMTVPILHRGDFMLRGNFDLKLSTCCVLRPGSLSRVLTGFPVAPSRIHISRCNYRKFGCGYAPCLHLRASFKRTLLSYSPALPVSNFAN
jgi:hypothetical protein